MSPEATIRAPLRSSARIETLDLFGVPYEVREGDDAPLRRLTSANDDRALLWPSNGGTLQAATLDGIPLFAPIVAEHEIDRLLGRSGKWEPCATLLDGEGAVCSSVRRGADGSVFVPFDPSQVAQTLLTETYLVPMTSGRVRLAKSTARRGYYRLRPLMPRPLQLALRRRFTKVQQRSPFPRWPIETALHDFREWLLAVVQEVAGGSLPQISWWPNEFAWTVVLTHDVERARGHAFVNEIVALEQRAGLRSAWYFVPERDYHVDDGDIARLAAGGFEVCLHGLRHDGRDLQRGVFEKRLPAISGYAERWGARGFRAPSTQRSWELIAQLGLDHDSSYSDVARFEPQGGGSCSWLPFFVGDVVELPITMPMDHTLFEILGERDEALWLMKAELLRQRHGMALMLTHPDYLLDDVARGSYEAFLDFVRGDETAWHALPREVADWWRVRNASSLRLDRGRWVVDGPAAANARVEVKARPSPFSPDVLGALSGEAV